MSMRTVKSTFRIVIMLIVFRLSISISEFTDNEAVNSEMYESFLNNVLNTPKQLQPKVKSDSKNQDKESPYERVIRNFRSNWETPMKYLQERGYLKNLQPQLSANNDLSMGAFNLINGPLLNPSTSKNVYPVPQGPNSLLSIIPDRSDRGADENIENDRISSATRPKSYEKSVRDCSDPSMNDLACINQFIGENMAKSVKDKWNSWFNKNQSSTTTTSTTTSSPTTSSTTPHSISNETTEVISDLSVQDARDGLEFFKIYNDFMLAKLAEKLSQDAHERQMLKSSQNEEDSLETFTMHSNPTVPPVPDFSRINENDIKVLKELDSCLRNRKTNLDANNIPIQKSEGVDGTANDGSNDSRVSKTYLPTKLKFLAHLHHEVFDIGQKKSLNKSSMSQRGCNVDITNFGSKS